MTVKERGNVRRGKWRVIKLAPILSFPLLLVGGIVTLRVHRKIDRAS